MDAIPGGDEERESGGAGRWSLRFLGHLLEVDVGTSGLSNTAKLFVDGALVEEKRTTGEKATLRGGGARVDIRWALWGGVSKCVASVDDGSDRVLREEYDFDPPPGSRAARMAEWGARHPRLYAARHVALAVVGVLLPLLGIGAIFRYLVPNLPTDWIPRPDIDLPDLPRNPLSRLLRPVVDWIREHMPDWDLPGWVREIMELRPWVLPIVIALWVAWREVQRRRNRERMANLETTGRGDEETRRAGDKASGSDDDEEVDAADVAPDGSPERRGPGVGGDAGH